MRILVVADEECKYFWDYYQPGRLKEYDLILSCGDLKSEYLSFLVTMGRAPVLYVHGNHDIHYEQRPPEGCICIEDTVYKHGDLRITSTPKARCESASAGCVSSSGGTRARTSS